MANNSPTLKDIHQSMQLLIGSVSNLTTKVEALELKLAAVEQLQINVNNVTKEVSNIREIVN
jgi:prefoldin subunit 5